jgi:hypothetical protein
LKQKVKKFQQRLHCIPTALERALFHGKGQVVVGKLFDASPSDSRAII